MKLPVAWLRDYIQTSLSDEALAERLTMAGLEVEETTLSAIGPVFHTKVTPNRGDWMSIAGSAREAAAALDTSLAHSLLTLPEEAPDVQRWAGVRVEAPLLCPRYAAKVVRNVHIGPSPGWMQDRLTAAGMRPLNVVVDITNYVMLELGQPLHAFDYDRLAQGQIVVRTARPGEQMTTLDGVERMLDQGMLLICDAEKPVAIAGVMGGAESEVSSETRHIFLESACFEPSSIRRTAKALGLSTEASYRYERSVDPELAPLALERACELLADLAGGEVVLGRIDLYPAPILPRTLSLRPSRVNALLGTSLDDATIAHSLRRLGLFVEPASNKWLVTVPTFRPDLVAEIDLVEEVGRMVGYETLPETLPPARSPEGGRDSAEGLFAAALRDLLTGFGLQEALTNSLAAPSPFDGPDDARRVQIRQALSAELSGLRVSLVPHLLEAVARNLRRREPGAALFEVGKVFVRGDEPGRYQEMRRVAMAAAGSVRPAAWDESTPPAMDFFSLKGQMEALARLLRLPPLVFTPSTRPGMHAGRCADVSLEGQPLGFVAEIDPHAAKEALDVPAGTGRIAVAELDVDLLLALSRTAPRFHSLPRFPAVSRDIAVVVDTATPYALLEDVARSAADPVLLQSLTLASLYTGDRMEPGKKSVALRLSFRAPDRTLTDAEVDSQMEAVRLQLAEQAGAERR